MQRALVIKIHGDKAIGNAIASGMESKELKDLRAIVGTTCYVRGEKNNKRIEDLHRRFPIKEHSERYDRFWGMVGLAWLLLSQRKKGWSNDI